MNRASFPTPRIVLSSFAMLGLLLGGCASSVVERGDEVTSESAALTSDICPDSVPAALTPAADQRLWFSLAGVGVQIYDCKATATGYAWVFRAPEADLLDAGGDVVGSHFAGPTWLFEDGSSVVAAKKAGVTVDAKAIPWLLLGAVSHGGDGRMVDVTTIQRLSTTGGLAPADGCDADHLGAVARTPYTAQYVFYKTASGSSDNPQCGG